MISVISLVILFFSGFLGCFIKKNFDISKYGSIASGIIFFIDTFTPTKTLNINWFSVNNLKFKFSFLFDDAGLFICSIICFILSCLHFAKILYKKNKKINSKMALLNIFAFFMCFSILSTNLVQFFIGIEAMGIISSLLVGFEEKSEIQSTKVFIFNKFASCLFLVATVLIAQKIGGFDFDTLKNFCQSSSVSQLKIPAFLLLISCLCKSSQVPFSYWIIDAVKATTFASIFIHTSTIVVIGIIFIAKTYFLFDAFEVLKKIMICVGLYTAFWMGCCAFFQSNIKKIMACLTSASVGLMFIACGLGFYSLALLYCICHAFFKSALFLSFSYVMSAMSHEQNIFKMGGLGQLIPKINDVVRVSFLSAIGFPFLVAFFAKISFAGSIVQSSMPFLEFPIMVVNVITIAALYRLVFLTMQGESRSDEIVLSRVSAANVLPIWPVWLLIGISVIYSFMSWSIYEWGSLKFGYGGVVYVRDFFDYIFDIAKLSVEIFIGILVVSFFKKSYGSKKILEIGTFFIRIFKKNDIYCFFINLIKKNVILMFSFFTNFNYKFIRFLNLQILKGAFVVNKIVSKFQKKYVFSHFQWILIGVLLSLFSVLIGVYK